MATRAHFAPIVFALALVVAVSASSEAVAKRRLPKECNVGDLVRQAAIVAHVRIAGPWPQGEHRGEGGLWLAEVLDAAQGTTAGQLILVQGCDASGDKIDFEVGHAYILLATREADGAYQPLADETGRWPIDGHGKLAAHPLAEELPPAHATGRPAEAIAWLKHEARRHDFAVAISLNDHDLDRYEPGKPLRLAIEIHNCGGETLAFNNHIEFEHHDFGSERLADEIKSSSPTVTVHAMPLSRERWQAALEMASQLISEEISIAAGERCAGEYDLGDEAHIYGGMRYQVWAEVGGRQSAPIVFDLPGQVEAIELVKRIEEFDDGGPFRMVKDHSAAQAAMPSVLATDEAAAINAAIEAWLVTSTSRDNPGNEPTDAPREIVLLSRARLPLEFFSTSDRYRIIIAEPPPDRLKEPVLFKLPGETVKYCGRKLRVERVEIARQSAVVELGEVHHGRVGATAKVRLRRTPSAWQASGEIELQHP